MRINSLIICAVYLYTLKIALCCSVSRILGPQRLKKLADIWRLIAMSLRPRSEYVFVEEEAPAPLVGSRVKPATFSTYTIKFYRHGVKGDEIPANARVAEVVENFYINRKLKLSFAMRRWGKRYFADHIRYENGRDETGSTDYQLQQWELGKNKKKIFMAKTKRKIEAFIKEGEVWNDNPDWNGKYSFEWF